MTLSGTFTLNGSGTGGARVIALDTSTSPPTAIGATTTNADGSWSISPGIDTTVECLLQYDDGSGNQYKARSKPYISHSSVTETIIDDFERSNPEALYSGGGSNWSGSTSQSTSGSQSLYTTVGDFGSALTSDGSLNTPSIGDTISWDLWMGSEGAGGMHFFVQDTSESNSYWVDLSNRDNRIRIGYWSGGSYTRLAVDSSFGPVSSEWMTCEVVTAQGSGEHTLDLTVTDSSGTVQSTLSASDTGETYASGMIGWSVYGTAGVNKYIDYSRYQ